MKKYVILATIFGVVYLLLPFIISFADEQKIEGFRELKWGTSIEEAQKIYPDLIFNENRKIDQDKRFYRKMEDKKIGDVVVDDIEYVFKGDRFFMVLAKISGKNSLGNFEPLKSSIESKYGQPIEFTKERISGLPGFERKATWILGESKITLVLFEGFLHLSLFIENIKPSGKLGF